MVEVCPYTPVIWKSTISGKTFAGSGSVFVEVPDGTTHNDVHKYVLATDQKQILEREALLAFMAGKTAKCPECLSIQSKVYPNSQGICVCNGCNDNFHDEV